MVVIPKSTAILIVSFMFCMFRGCDQSTLSKESKVSPMKKEILMAHGPGSLWRMKLRQDLQM